MRIHVFNARYKLEYIVTILSKCILALFITGLLAAGVFCLVKTVKHVSFTSIKASIIPVSFWENILSRGLPSLAARPSQSSGSSEEAIISTFSTLATPLVLLPKDTGKAHPLTAEETYETILTPMEESLPPSTAEEVFPKTKNPLVAIYNTHNAESYKPSQGKNKLPGKNGGVVEVATVLAETLTENFGIPVVRSSTIHDYPDFAKSYANSEKTLIKLLAKHPSILVALDIHRDAGLDSAPVVEINKQRVAQILIVVGSDARLENPNWRQNEIFAQKLAAKMDKMYPGLCRGVRVLEGRYNQHLLPRSLLLEFGSDNNTLEEAKRAARLMAKVLAELIEEIQKENPTLIS